MRVIFTKYTAPVWFSDWFFSTRNTDSIVLSVWFACASGLAGHACLAWAVDGSLPRLQNRPGGGAREVGALARACLGAKGLVVALGGGVRNSGAKATPLKETWQVENRGA